MAARTGRSEERFTVPARYLGKPDEFLAALLRAPDLERRVARFLDGWLVMMGHRPS